MALQNGQIVRERLVARQGGRQGSAPLLRLPAPCVPLAPEDRVLKASRLVRSMGCAGAFAFLGACLDGSA